MITKKIKNYIKIFFFLPQSLLLAQEYEINYETSHLETIENVQNLQKKELGKQDFKKNVKLLKNSLSVPIIANDVTFYHTKSYLDKKWVAKIIGLSGYYFPLFEKKLKQYNIPNELKYLAIVESALNPRAESQMGAMGLWQFIPETGENYGLKANDDINIFFDPMANTDSAMRFLKKLFEKYDDWLLAISAYNCGAGNVDKAIKKAGTSEYWKVREFLPKETRAYVPTFLAVCYVFNFYEDYNIQIPTFKYKFSDFKILKIDKNTSIKEFTKKNKTPYNIFKFANPQLLNDYIPKGTIVYVLK